MLYKTIGSLALGIGCASAFKDTSPFFLFSTSELLASSPNLVTAKSLSETLTHELEACTSDTYVIVSQPGVSVEDYRDRQSAPHLRMRIRGEDKTVRSSLVVKDVVGGLDPVRLSGVIQAKCSAGHLRIDASTGSFPIADDANPRVINLDFPALPSGVGRSSKLVENDAFLASVLNLLPSPKYTVLYTTTPSGNVQVEAAHSESYEMDSMFQAPMHTELKRDFSGLKRASDANITLPDGPLFERYQYFSPGLFMGLLVFFILSSILYVGISAIAGLQVSYAAFDREMGPAAQKKQAQ